MRPLCLHPPSFDGFDGGAGSRYQARREIRSFWYPTWLAQPAALVPGSKLIDAPPARLRLDDVLPLARDYELVVMHTSTPSFAADVKVAQALKDTNPHLKIGLVGAKVAVEPEPSLTASRAIDFVAREEFDFTIKEVAEGRRFADIDGLSYRNGNGVVVHNRARPVLEDMDRLPFVTEVYKRDLRVEDYFIGYLKHPYLSLYTGRGCRSKCTFCLWPQTVGGHRYRVRSVEHVIEEIRLARDYFPEAKDTIEEPIQFASDINPHSIQVSLAAPYPGTYLYRQAVENGWLDESHAELVDERGVQIAPLHYPHLGHTEIFQSVEKFYRRFYFRRRKIASLLGEMLKSPEMMRRRVREGVEFFQFLREREMAS